MTQAPLHWIRQAHQAVIDTQKIPLSGYLPVFPWEEVSKKMATLFQSPELKIRLRQVQLLLAEEITQGFGSHFVPLAVDLTPLQGQAFFLMGKEEINQLAALGLTSSPAGQGFLSTSFREGFYYYLCTEAILALNALNAFGDLSVKIGKAPPLLPQEESLCIDIEISHPKRSFFGRIICPASLHQVFKDHFHTPQPVSISGLLAQQTQISTAITIGQTELSITEWKGVKQGDFITLDRCTFDPQTKKGTAVLCLENTPLLRLRIKEDHLKIVNYATYHEELHSMDPILPESDDEHEEFSSPEVDEDTNAEHLWSSEPTNVDNEEESLISTAQIPLTLVIEVGRLKMSLEELLNLSPGNTLELPVRPQHGVDITIQGKKVAKAELIKLGEMLGVKILKLAE